MPSAHHDVVLGQRLARMVREQHEHVTKDALGGSVKLKIRERPCQAHAGLDYRQSESGQFHPCNPSDCE